MSRCWHMSANSEILIMTFIGLATTVMEGIYLNLRENIKEVWILSFPEELFSTGLENLVKTILSGIIITRGATVHAALASYLLIIYPVITEKLRIMLVVWMVINAFRGILINIVATCTGCVLCAAYPDIRPVCFEFAITKAVELACSIFMWVNVNDFYHALGSKQRNVAANTDVVLTTNSIKFELNRELDQEISFGSFSFSKSFFEKFRDSSLNVDSNKEEDPSSINSVMAKNTFEWFINKVTVFNDKKEIVIDEKRALDLFVEMSSDDLIKFQQKLKMLMDKSEIKNNKETLCKNNTNETNDSTSSSNNQNISVINNIANSSNTKEAINISASSNNTAESSNEKEVIINTSTSGNKDDSVNRNVLNTSASSNNAVESSNNAAESSNNAAESSNNAVESSNNAVESSNNAAESSNEQKLIINSSSSKVVNESKKKATGFINKLLVECIMIAVDKFENSKSMAEELERNHMETNKEKNEMKDSLKRKLFPKRILKILPSIERISLKDDDGLYKSTFDENEILQNVDQTTIVRAMYERKSNQTSLTHKPSKKIIWRAKDDRRPGTSSQ